MRSLADQGLQQQVRERISNLSPDARRVWGAMSAPEMLCHLNDSFLVALGERKATFRSNLFSRTVMKFFALHVPMPWPRNVPTMPEVKQGVGGTCPMDFEQDRARLLRTFDRFCAPPASLEKAPHPLFGPLTTKDWLIWGYLHSDHHLRQFGV